LEDLDFVKRYSPHSLHLHQMRSRPSVIGDRELVSFCVEPFEEVLVFGEEDPQTVVTLLFLKG